MCTALLLALTGCGGSTTPAPEADVVDYRPSNLLEAVLLGDEQAVEQFLTAGANVNATEADGTTPLMRAIHGRFPGIATRLIDAGANGSIANRYGVTALYLAARAADVASTRALLRAGADANSALPEGETVLMTAAKSGNADIVRALLTGGQESLALSQLAALRAATDDGESDYSGYSGYTGTPRQSTRTGPADPNARDGWYGQTALMWAAAEGHTDVIRLLVEAGADVNLHSGRIGAPEPAPERLDGRLINPPLPKGGLTALHFAARAGQLDAARTLIDVGADLNAVDLEGTSAAVYATLSGHLHVTGGLLRAGADPDVSDSFGRTVLFVATDWHALEANEQTAHQLTGDLTPIDIVELALAKGANPNAALTAGLPEYLAENSGRGPILNAGATPFFRAALSGDLEIMNVLLAAGADPLVTTAARAPVTIDGIQYPSNGKTTSFMAAAGVGWRETTANHSRDGDAIKTLELLLAKGADINAANQMGNTALHGAALRGSTTIIQFLVDHGANLRAKNAAGHTPLDIAMGVPDENVPYNEAAAALLRRLAQRA